MLEWFSENTFLTFLILCLILAFIPFERWDKNFPSKYNPQRKSQWPRQCKLHTKADTLTITDTNE